MATWNPWHGCTKTSAGCAHCYVYRRDAEFGRDTSVVHKTAFFDLPLRKNRWKEYKLQPERFSVGLPADWGNGYENVHIVCTCENQSMTRKRLPVFLQLPICHKEIIHEPMLEAINIRPFLKQYHEEIELVSCGGKSGDDARICDFGWILDTMAQCVEYNVAFHFHQTGYNFRRGNRIYHIDRKDQHEQAAKAGVDFTPHK